MELYNIIRATDLCSYSKRARDYDIYKSLLATTLCARSCIFTLLFFPLQKQTHSLVTLSLLSKLFHLALPVEAWRTCVGFAAFFCCICFLGLCVFWFCIVSVFSACLLSMYLFWFTAALFLLFTARFGCGFSYMCLNWHCFERLPTLATLPVSTQTTER